ncbi:MULTISPECIES: DUF6562 domain-containing protein [Bacteroidaceae]|uniref:DUF6562 domain-containing protein n=1 Tax=Phocaeicola intestinalis TaxID=2762212 RepID=A0ABR8Y9F9_9BACT|nr:MULTISPECIES: DUF6562 domain-containing protein [Bacteroidaceae]MBD8040837.1 hypothetical protein [Phocaeicola intestinalis]MBM6659739.1 hypothetical protein [Bacteroides gallinaceum]
MKRNRHIRKFWSGLLALPFLMAACTLHEEPELTADGELGVDPTEVNVEVNLTLDLNLPEQGNEENSSARVSANTDYLHRFIVEAYFNRQPVARQVFVENITDRTHLSLPVSMKLHARSYQLVVWKDYVSAETPEEDLHYNTQSLVPVIPNRASHTGNTEYKDVFVGTTSLDLTAYADQWGAVVEQDVTLQRPVARYELIATDVADFLQRVADGEVNGETFTARIKYSGYLPVGYNALDNVPKHSLMYMQYNTSFELPEEGTDELRVGFDYVFVSNEGSASVPMEIEIVNEENVTVANSVLNVPLERGKNTVWTGEFLTGDDQGGQGGDEPGEDEGGIGIDPDYDNETDLGVTVE